MYGIDASVAVYPYHPFIAHLLHTLIIIITTPLLYSHYTLFLNIIGNLSIFMYTNLEISIEKNPSYLFVTPLLPPYCTLITPLLHPYRHHHHHHTHIYITLGNLSISMLINLEISIEKSSYYFLITPLLYPHYSLIIQIHNKWFVFFSYILITPNYPLIYIYNRQFEHIDVDKSGNIDREEFMGSVGEQRSPFTDRLFDLIGEV
jgi:hypothetical protein